MAIATLHSFVYDCPDPKALADFYAELLGWEIVKDDTDWVTIGDGGPVHLAFQHAPDYVPPVWPQVDHPQQAHLDVVVDDLVEAGKKVVALGAVKHHHQPGNEEGFVVYLDPAGHLFCLCD
ncbi:VOC family protein [Herbidospora galbida]|uniref:VOC family protein n=1 Tax=Herbidospora galbida TaxID=2575442 RepID=A0A4U3MFN9_9ACTN|nr:VOC family protein [Herbidospora galbida]TKK87114.1 VOC family protein [Herbidospora galbida]